MNSPFFKVCCLLAGFTIPLTDSAVLAQEADPDPIAAYQSLLDNSPFVPLEFRERTNSPTLRRITFHGGLQLEGKWVLCFYDQDRNESVWVPVGEKLREYTVKSYSPQNGEVVLENEGNSVSVKLQ